MESKLQNWTRINKKQKYKASDSSDIWDYVTILKRHKILSLFILDENSNFNEVSNL